MTLEKPKQMVTLYGGASIGTKFAFLELTVPVSSCKVVASGSRREVSEAMRRKVIGYEKGVGSRARAIVIPV